MNFYNMKKWFCLTSRSKAEANSFLPLSKLTMRSRINETRIFKRTVSFYLYCVCKILLNNIKLKIPFFPWLYPLKCPRSNFKPVIHLSIQTLVLPYYHFSTKWNHDPLEKWIHHVWNWKVQSKPRMQCYVRR